MATQRSPRGGGRPSPYGNISWRGGGGTIRGGGGLPPRGSIDWRKWAPYIAGAVAFALFIWIILTENLLIVIFGTLLLSALALILGGLATGAFMVLFPLIAQAFGLSIKN